MHQAVGVADRIEPEPGTAKVHGTDQPASEKAAVDCFRNYLQLLVLGRQGSYSMEDARREVSRLLPRQSRGAIEHEVMDSFDSTLQNAGFPKNSAKLDLEKLLAG